MSADSIDTLTNDSQLSEPVEQPTEQPNDKPVEPTEQPVEQPTDKPVDPTDKPVEQPVEPTDKPVDPTDKPVEPVEQPVEPTEQPVEQPVEPTEQPVEFDEIFTAKITEIKSRLDNVTDQLNNFMGNLSFTMSEISKLKEQLVILSSLGIDSESVLADLTSQMYTVQNQYNDIEKYQNTLYGTLYNVLYDNLLKIGTFTVNVYRTKPGFAGDDLVDLFGGFTDEDNIPVSGNYRKYVGIPNYAYTVNDCNNLCKCIVDTFILLESKITALNTLSTNAQKSTELGYKLGSFVRIINDKIDEISTNANNFNVEIDSNTKGLFDDANNRIHVYSKFVSDISGEHIPLI
jgi:hypothetical protein